MKYNIAPFKVFLVVGLIGCQHEMKTVHKKSESRFEMINGCRKEVSEKLFDRYGKDSLSWVKSYRIDQHQTCDFSSYVIVRKKYRDGKLAAQTSFIAGCDECEEIPCGEWHYFDEDGKNIDSKDYGECDLEQFDK